MELCLECGVPDLVCRDYRWSGGTVVNLRNGREYVFLDCRLLKSVYEVFEFLDGPRAALIMTEARRRVVREEAMLSLGFMSRHLNTWFVRRQALNSMRDSAACHGLGSIRVRSYEPMGRAVLEVADPCFHPLVEAEVRAYWEAVEGFQPLLRCEVSQGLTVFHLDRPQEEKRKVGVLRKSAPPREAVVRPAPSGEPTSLCTTCGAPIEISRFNWNLARGTVYDSVREAHVCLLSVPSVSAMIMDLRRHYGEGVEGLLLRIARSYMKGLTRSSMLIRNMEGEEFLRSLAVRGGTGPIRIRGGSGRLELELGNPWSWPILVGEISGWLESRETDGRKVSWKVDKDSGSLRMRWT